MNKTVTVKVDGSLSDEIYNAGTMYEHNATTLVFEIDAQYISPQYRYYLEFALPTELSERNILRRMKAVK